MKTLYSEFTGEFYDAAYYETGRISGKSWLMDYKWMPQRSFREALAFIDYLGLDEKSSVLDFGCAKGFLVRALRELGINAEGCDISSYALQFAPAGCWNAEDDWCGKHYTHVVCKDVLEHFTPEQLTRFLERLKSLTDTFMCIVPMGHNGIYRIPEYHCDISHIIAENEEWWGKRFTDCGWVVTKHTPHVKGIKDNWQGLAEGRGNHVYKLRTAI